MFMKSLILATSYEACTQVLEKALHIDAPDQKGAFPIYFPYFPLFLAINTRIEKKERNVAHVFYKL